MADIKLDGLTVASSSGSPTAVSLDSTVDIKGCLNATGSAPVYACRAWVNFVGSSVTDPASATGINQNGNVTSLFRNGTGDYTINFGNDMPTADFVVSACTLMLSRDPRTYVVRDTSVSHFRIGIFDGNSLTDTTDEIMIAVFC